MKVMKNMNPRTTTDLHIPRLITGLPDNQEFDKVRNYHKKVRLYFEIFFGYFSEKERSRRYSEPNVIVRV